MKPDSHGLTVLPFLSGERAPGYHGEVWAPTSLSSHVSGSSFQAHCTITGIHPGTSSADMVRAGTEAVVMRLAEVGWLLASSRLVACFISSGVCDTTVQFSADA